MPFHVTRSPTIKFLEQLSGGEEIYIALASLLVHSVAAEFHPVFEATPCILVLVAVAEVDSCFAESRMLEPLDYGFRLGR
mmetsp:Transcript_17691/g.25471  ORF Transcript_17691/g.25471 Transcript_17691/m.25471 type:complete len:80 (+) Transcript_17691:1302-1541(+)